jgi:hypothetical protein
VEPESLAVVLLSGNLVTSMRKAKEYRAHAAYCKQRADEATDPDAKREFEALEQKWISLAEGEEEIGEDSSRRQ